MIILYLLKSEYGKIPDSHRGVFHPHPNNHNSKKFEGLPSITLNATHREYVVGREIEVVENLDGIPKDKIGTIITCESCKELSFADKTNPTMCPYCANLYRATKKMPEKADMPEALQKVAAITELSTLALQKEYKRVVKVNGKKNPVVDTIAKKQFVYRFYTMIAQHSWLLQNFMTGHSANFSDDQRKAVYLAANELNNKLENKPSKYAKTYGYYKKYILDGIPNSKIAFQDGIKNGEHIKKAMADFISDLLSDDWQLRFIMGYSAANQAIHKAFPKRNKDHVTEADVAKKLIAKILAAGDLYKYVVPAEEKQIPVQPSGSATIAETEKVCKSLLHTFYKNAFIVHPYIEDPIHTRTEMTPCWQPSETPRQYGKNAYDISIPSVARENLYTLSMYMLSCFLSIYCNIHDIQDESEKIADLATEHGLKTQKKEDGSIDICDINDKTLELLDSQSWPKWLYFCVRDCREKKIIDEENQAKEEMLHYLSIANISAAKPKYSTDILLEQQNSKSQEENELLDSQNPAGSVDNETDAEKVETYEDMDDDEASRLYGRMWRPYQYRSKKAVSPEEWPC